jgi:hypothetical protein
LALLLRFRPRKKGLRTQPSDPSSLEEWQRLDPHASARTGATALCIFEQSVTPGAGAPTRSHSVEEG